MDFLKESAAAEALVAANRRALSSSLRLESELAGLLPDALDGVVGLQQFEPVLERTSVYFLCSGGAVVYVGQTNRLEQRLVVHQRDEKRFDRVFFIDVPRPDLDHVEQAFIRALQPSLNQTRRPYDAVSALIYNDKRALLPYWPTFIEPSDPETRRQAERSLGRPLGERR
jgi:hypothetical protein